MFQTTVFKQNPYFWNQYGDRITSYVPSVKLDGAEISSNRIVFTLDNQRDVLCR